MARSPGGSLIVGLQEAVDSSLDSSVDEIDRVSFAPSADGLSVLQDGWESSREKRDDPDLEG